MRQRLISAATLYLALAAIGAFIAVTQRLPYQFGGQGDPNNVWGDFVSGSGTAMSPPLGAMIVFAVFLLIATRRGGIGKLGAIGLIGMALLFIAGGLGEPLTFDSINPADPDPWKGIVQWGALVMAALVVYYGVRTVISREGKERKDGKEGGTEQDSQDGDGWTG